MITGDKKTFLSVNDLNEIARNIAEQLTRLHDGFILDNSEIMLILNTVEYLTIKK